MVLGISTGNAMEFQIVTVASTDAWHFVSPGERVGTSGAVRHRNNFMRDLRRTANLHGMTGVEKVEKN